MSPGMEVTTMKNTALSKKVLFGITTLFLLLLLSQASPHEVFASTIPDDLKESSAAIQKMAEECYKTEHSKKPDQITIDYDSAYGIYIDVDLFRGSSKSFCEVMDLCKKAPMCYIVPVQVDEESAVVEVSRGLPLNTSASSLLTEEEKEEIRNNEGKWIPASLTFDAGQKSIEQQVDDTLTQNGISSEADHCLVGGVPGIHDLILVADTRDGCVYIPFAKSISTAYESNESNESNESHANVNDSSYEPITYDSSEGQSAVVSSNSPDVIPSGEDSQLKEGHAYSYEDFQKIARKNLPYEQADDIVSGGVTAARSSGYRVIIAIGIGILIAIASVLIGIRLKNHRSNSNSK